MKPRAYSDALILASARGVVNEEANALRLASKGLGADFVRAVRIILSSGGKLVVVGVGKSGIIARKIAATLSSTGTPSVYIHPVESLHGDMGLIAKNDVVLALSYSGETEETTKMLALLANEGLKIISLTNNPASKLAKYSTVALKLNVRNEACPYDIVPTSSTAAMLAIGDAIAITLMKIKGFSRSHFARLHPGGNLGKLLNIKVADIMQKGAANPVIKRGKSIREALTVMTRSKAGAVSVVDPKGRLAGFFTDGDLRRHLQAGGGIGDRIETVMTKKPVVTYPDTMAIEAAKTISARKIDNIPVVDRKTLRSIGLIDEKDLLREGLI